MMAGRCSFPLAVLMTMPVHTLDLFDVNFHKINRIRKEKTKGW